MLTSNLSKFSHEVLVILFFLIILVLSLGSTTFIENKSLSSLPVNTVLLFSPFAPIEYLPSSSYKPPATRLLNPSPKPLATDIAPGTLKPPSTTLDIEYCLEPVTLPLSSTSPPTFVN